MYTDSKAVPGLSAIRSAQFVDLVDDYEIHKSDLSLRPIWRQAEHRVRAQILVCFLAYVLWKTLEQWQ